jgi:hypothetical protein
MRNILHILTTSDDAWAERIIALERQQPDLEIKVVDLTTAGADYRALLDEIFAADSIQVW